MMVLTLKQRQSLPQWSLKHNGWGDGTGYPGKKNNPACNYLKRHLEYSCADGYTASCGNAGFPLKPVETGMSQGAAFVPYLYAEAKKTKCLRKSWEGQVGDALFINTGTGAQPGHIEMVIFHNSGAAYQAQLEKLLGVKLVAAPGVLYSIGWDSGPSNVDKYKGQGGVHLHVWNVPKGVGHPSIIAAGNVEKLIDWTKAATDHGATLPKPVGLSKTADGQVTALTSELDAQDRPFGPKAKEKLRTLRESINEALEDTA